MIKLRKIGLNIIIASGNQLKTITVPKDYNTDILFTLVGKIHSDIKIAEKLFWKEIAKFEKPVVKDNSILEARINRKKISKEIKKIQSFDYSKLPILIPQEWQEVLNSKADNEHIKNFLLLLSLNPNKYTRDNLLNSLSSKYPFITSSGYLVLTRQLWKVNEVDPLYDFIQSSYVKIKGQKKGPRNYYIVNKNNYQLVKGSSEFDGALIGNLNDLYNTYQPKEKTVYCSDYNFGKPEQESWSIGDIIKIDNPDFSDEICGKLRFHVKTDPKSNIGNSSYGDTTVIVLVNPKNIISIRESWKITCSELKICAIVTDDEIKDTFVSDFEHFDYDYIQEDFEEVKKLVSDKSKGIVDNRKLEDKSKIKGLKATITNTEYRKVLAQDFNEILRNRINLIN